MITSAMFFFTVGLSTVCFFLLLIFDKSYLCVCSICFASVFITSKIFYVIQEEALYSEKVSVEKIAFQKDETPVLNFVLQKWWGVASSSIEELLKKHLTGLLCAIQLKFVVSLELIEFKIGEQPKIMNIKAHDSLGKLVTQQDKLSSNQIIMEADIDKKPDDFKMIFRALLGFTRALSFGVKLEVYDIDIRGILQAVAYLSSDTPPLCITKARVSFKERPYVKFNILTLKRLKVMRIPYLNSWIQNYAMEQLDQAISGCPGSCGVLNCNDLV